ncbi:hypothetical protein PY257_02665 [Ramlibacter sp. H39-3-26]|uniref:hypothetical protein n=1 Tax=Curvibacter soli TaxID=3031331 RepID=UPI0023DB7472|nr:hypothetical protein [Ramlibacter sp. H39-3-26]MDF1484094.1 hypothetical protein [Ramlibacter sp. H39-3-26]
MSLRPGLLCLFENPTDEAGRALIRQFVLVREAERHGDAARRGGAITTLFGHLGGVPMSAHSDTARHILADRVDQVRPLREA